MGNRLPSWLAPRLASVPEPLTVARARLAGQARAKKCTAATLSRIGRQGGKAAAAALTLEERRAKASLAGQAANLVRWGWSQYKLTGAPLMSHCTYQVLDGLERSQAGMYPAQAWRAYVDPGATQFGHAYAVFRNLLSFGWAVKTDQKSQLGHPLYVITQAGRDVLVAMRALIVS